MPPEQEEMIRLFAEFGFSFAQLAQEYEIHTNTVRSIVNGAPDVIRKDRKLTDDQIRQVRAWHAQGWGQQRISQELGIISKSSVRQILRGNSYRNVV
jgi:hypothetical protein